MKIHYNGLIGSYGVAAEMRPLISGGPAPPIDMVSSIVSDIMLEQRSISNEK